MNILSSSSLIIGQKNNVWLVKQRKLKEQIITVAYLHLK